MGAVENLAVGQLALHVAHDALPQRAHPGQVVRECRVHDAKDALPGSSAIRARSTALSRCGLYAGSAVLTRTRRITSRNVGLSGSGSCCEHERRWSSNSLISTALMRSVVMSGFRSLRM